MRIGIDIRLIGKKRTGDEAVFFNLVKNLALIDKRNEYRLFTDIVDEKIITDITRRLDIENKNNFQIISLKTKNKFTWNFWTLPNYLRKNPVDAYLTQYITPWFVPSRIKILTIIHDISFNFYPQLIKFTDWLFLKILIPLSLHRADKIISVSKFTRDEIIKYYNINPEKIDWMHNAVPDNFSAEITPSELEEVRKKYNLPEKFILYIGTLQPRKNLPTLIGAYAKIKNKLPQIKLVLAGNRNGHNFDKKIDVAVKQAGLSDRDIYFPGFIDENDKPAIFKLAKIFCFPSFYEGFGIPIIEAMASKTPAVISAIPPHKEIAGDSAIYFNPQDLDNLAEKLYNISIDENLQNKLITSGENQAKFFSWQKSAVKLLEILKK